MDEACRRGRTIGLARAAKIACRPRAPVLAHPRLSGAGAVKFLTARALDANCCDPARQSFDGHSRGEPCEGLSHFPASNEVLIPATPHRRQAKPRSDPGGVVEAKIRTALAENISVAAAPLGVAVSVANDRVTLAGMTCSGSMRARAEKVAQAAAGILQIDNRIVCMPARG
jgi:BON domain